MAGHSKWAGIKHKKAVVDARRGKLFAKLIRGVEVAAREAGTSNPESDMTLAAAVDRAKQYSVPGDTIEKAAKRGAGELDEQVVYERVLYEGYAPGGIALLAEALTENRNRTSQEVRAVFSKLNGSLGEPGSVAYLFERKGVITVIEASEEQVFEASIEAGAEDVTGTDDGWEIVCDAKDFAAVRSAIGAAGLRIERSELAMLPTTTVETGADAARPVLKLMDALEDLDDIQGVYTNLDAPDEVFAELA